MIGLLTLILLLMGGCMGYNFMEAEAPAIEVPPVAETTELQMSSSSGTSVLLLIQDQTFGDQELEETFAGLERRLSASEMSGAVSTFGATCLEVQLYNSDVDPSSLDGLIAPGLVELVDFSGIPDSMEGTLISTTAMDRDDGLVNPNTEAPFETIITGAQMQSAVAQLDDFSGSWIIAFDLTPEGAEIFGPFTQMHIGEKLAIVYEGKVVSAPTIQSRLDTSAIITGNFTEMEAEAIAVQLNAGALPLSLEILAVDVFSGGSPFLEQEFAIDSCG